MSMDIRRDTQKVTGTQECAGCGKKIADRYLLKALDMYWHEDCLKCGCCDCRLGEVGSTLFTKANLILCKRDYLRLFGATGYCAACNKVIPAFEMVMRARSNVYHLECFACQQCNHRFCVGDRFYLWDNKILCEYDYEERLVFANIPYHGNPNGAGPPGQIPQQLPNDAKSPLPPGAGGGGRNPTPMQQQQSPGNGGYMSNGQHQMPPGMMPNHHHHINGIPNDAMMQQQHTHLDQQQQSLPNGQKLENTAASSPVPGGDASGKYYLTLTSNNNMAPMHSDGSGGGGSGTMDAMQQQVDSLGRNGMICNGAFNHQSVAVSAAMATCRIPSPHMTNSIGGNAQQQQKAK